MARLACIVTLVMLLTTTLASSPLVAQTIEDQRNACQLYDDGGKAREGTTPDRAIDACTMLIQSGSESQRNLAALFTNRGTAYNDKGERDLAGRDYDQAIKEYAKYAEAWVHRCALKIELDLINSALVDCDRAIKLDAKLPTAHDNRGDIYLELGKLDAAIDDYTLELQINPDMDAALYGRGVARTLRGDQAGGAADIAAAKKLNPRVSRDQPHLARLLPSVP